MKRKMIGVLLLLLAALLAWAGWEVSRLTVSALEGPGAVETWVATRAKRWLVARAAKKVPPAPPPSTAAATMGGMQFRADCAACHGSDGRTPTAIGRAMSPRAPDLGRAETQAWSDAELFWTIKHGIKMTGMPGFGPQHDDERIWQLVYYVREIGKQPRP